MRDPRLQCYIEFFEQLTLVSLEDIGRVMTEGPLRMKGMFARMAQPFIGL
jgi:hypothetical protein